ITGYIEVRDEYFNPLDDFSGVSINIKGTNYITQSDSTGKWTLTDIPAGVYDLIYSKSGFDSLLIFGFSFAGNGTAFVESGLTKYFATESYFPYTTHTKWVIEQLPSVNISNLSFDTKYLLYMRNEDSIEYLPLTINSDMKTGLTIFMSNNPEVSKYSYQTHFWAGRGLLSFEFDSVKNIRSYGISKYFLTSYYKNGGKIYAIAYPGSYGYTKDLRNGYIHWARFGKPSEVVSFDIP
ncbi:MAG: hypothetical protein ACTSO2_19490, partial [Promethearchaeota archaeon]